MSQRYLPRTHSMLASLMDYSKDMGMPFSTITNVGMLKAALDIMSICTVRAYRQPESTANEVYLTIIFTDCCSVFVVVWYELFTHILMITDYFVLLYDCPSGIDAILVNMGEWIKRMAMGGWWYPCWSYGINIVGVVWNTFFGTTHLKMLRTITQTCFLCTWLFWRASFPNSYQR